MSKHAKRTLEAVIEALLGRNSVEGFNTVDLANTLTTIAGVAKGTAESIGQSPYKEDKDVAKVWERAGNQLTKIVDTLSK